MTLLKIEQLLWSLCLNQNTVKLLTINSMVMDTLWLALERATIVMSQLMKSK